MRNGRSFVDPLFKDQNPLGVAFSHFRCQLGVPSLCEGDSSFLEMFFCG